MRHFLKKAQIAGLFNTTTVDEGALMRAPLMVIESITLPFRNVPYVLLK